MNVVTINSVVAAIIASITFAAAIQIPGRYDGTSVVANLRDETSFKFFLAFGFSAASIFIHYLTAFYSGYVQEVQFYPLSSLMLLTASIAASILACHGYKICVGPWEFPLSFADLGLTCNIACFAFCIPVCFFLISFLIV